MELRRKAVASSEGGQFAAGSSNPHNVDTVLADSLTSCAVLAVSAAGIVLSWNSGAHNIFGYSNGEIVGKPIDHIFTREDADAGEPLKELQAALSERGTQQDRWHVQKTGRGFGPSIPSNQFSTERARYSDS